MSDRERDGQSLNKEEIHSSLSSFIRKEQDTISALLSLSLVLTSLLSTSDYRA